MMIDYNFRKEQIKEWRKNNPERVKEIKGRYRENNKDKIKEYNTQYEKTKNAKERTERYKEKDKFIDTRERYNKSEEGKASRQRGDFMRRVKMGEIISTLTSKEWLDILERYNYRCAYCDVEFEVENMPTKDHVIPISRGGGNTKENIVPACQTCNSKKHNKLDYNILARGEV